ncbi:mannosyltransferase-like protein [Novymonas esmeraldas]|uniref:Mannosyltransferase-like protein n=1 Tax=Novymonas esmeraldas TaxID=1808958 RepID=A0AAW0EUW5_9TRYP
MKRRLPAADDVCAVRVDTSPFTDGTRSPPRLQGHVRRPPPRHPRCGVSVCALCCLAVVAVLAADTMLWGVIPAVYRSVRTTPVPPMVTGELHEARLPSPTPLSRDRVSVSLIVPVVGDGGVALAAPELVDLVGPLLHSGAALCRGAAVAVHAVVVSSAAASLVAGAVQDVLVADAAAEGVEGGGSGGGTGGALTPAEAWRVWSVSVAAARAAVGGDAACLGDRVTVVAPLADLAAAGAAPAPRAVLEALVDAGLRTPAGRAGSHFVVLSSFLAAARMPYTEPGDARETRREGSGLLDALVRTATQRNGGRVAAAQCTVLARGADARLVRAPGDAPYPPSLLTPADLAHFVVLDKGGLTGMSHRNASLLPYLTRRRSGYAALDQRASWEEVVDAVSLHCGIFDRRLYDAVGGLAATLAAEPVRFVEALSRTWPPLHQRAHAVLAPDRGGWALTLRMQEIYPDWQVWSSRGVAVLRDDVAGVREWPAVSVLQQPVMSLLDRYGQVLFPLLTWLQRRRVGVSWQRRETDGGGGRWSTQEAALLPPVMEYHSEFEDACCGLSIEAMGYIRPLMDRYAIGVAGEREVCRKHGDALLHLAYGRLTFLWRAAGDPAAVTFFRARHRERLRVHFQHWRGNRYLWRLVGAAGAAPTVNVGRSLSEFSNVPLSWVAPMRQRTDAVWATADFFSTIYRRNGIDPAKVRVVPEAVDVYEYDPANYVRRPVLVPRQRADSFDNRPQLTEAERLQRYVFFTNFKWEDRKGWDVLLGAYWDAFGPGAPAELRERTTLVIKTKFESSFTRGVTHTNLLRFIEAWGKRGSLAGIRTLDDYPHMVVIGASVSSTELVQLYANADAFVYPTKAEGWGLPAVEAMAMGLPVLITEWSGQLRFMERDSCFRIPLDGLEEIASDSPYGYAEGMKMALPSREKTAELMQYVVQHPEHARRVGRRAREYAVRELSEEAVADTMDRLLCDIIRRRIATGNV